MFGVKKLRIDNILVFFQFFFVFPVLLGSNSATEILPIYYSAENGIPSEFHKFVNDKYEKNLFILCPTLNKERVRKLKEIEKKSLGFNLLVLFNKNQFLNKNLPINRIQFKEDPYKIYTNRWPESLSCSTYLVSNELIVYGFHLGIAFDKNWIKLSPKKISKPLKGIEFFDFKASLEPEIYSSFFGDTNTLQVKIDFPIHPKFYSFLPPEIKVPDGFFVESTRSVSIGKIFPKNPSIKYLYSLKGSANREILVGPIVFEFNFDGHHQDKITIDPIEVSLKDKKDSFGFKFYTFLIILLSLLVGFSIWFFIRIFKKYKEQDQ